MATEQNIRKDAYYAWYRPTNEYLASGSGWTKDVSIAFACGSREFAWKCLEQAYFASGRDIEKGCVSLGIDLIEEEEDEEEPLKIAPAAGLSPVKVENKKGLFFAFCDDGMGLRYHATRKEAEDDAKELLRECQEDAASGHGWPDDVGAICWGEILGQVECTKAARLPEDFTDWDKEKQEAWCDKNGMPHESVQIGFDCWCEYELKDRGSCKL